MLSVANNPSKLSVVMLNVVRESVVMLNVMAPQMKWVRTLWDNGLSSCTTKSSYKKWEQFLACIIKLITSRNLWISVISESVCTWQAFPA
jgi:hypothetical protein